MDKRGWMMLRVFINCYNPKAGEALLKFLPQEEVQAVLSQDIRSTDLTPILYQPQKLLERMHYSWIEPLLGGFPEKLHPLVMAALTQEQISGLNPVIAPSTLSNPVKTFIINQLYTLLKADEHLPYDYLPETDLSPLGTWSKARLTELIDFLGLHDLASEMRHIVDKNQLKNIYTSLSSKQFYYLKVCLHQKEILSVPKLGIDPSKRDSTKLKRIVHRRGLLRLGKALCGQHPDFVWYLAHTLDTGRGKLILNAYQPESVPQVTSFLKGQVLNLMNFLKSE
ncbi:conserved hypothetical protein [Candidatus Protochlamydia naegleriophila]|uniref:Uncharacterized protein n=1 Tax=Candidatus Protochlamydia naegleriophila TaxID=389348 RepID=A0A0U5EPG3_9BACT|nr:hypothetical protein [Candidatus Protochlamydia naegleriophila]CUI15843.1 conserved hypothetical protein [Candidatus Protochlamydia naegleriophila]